MIDIAHQISAISRQVAADTETATVTLQRRYPAAVTDVWDAITDSPEAQQFCVESIEEWTAAVQTTGSADGEAIPAGREAALAQFAPDLVS